MPKHRDLKAVRVDDLISEILATYTVPDGVTRKQIASAAVFLYFVLPDEARGELHAFYEAWRRARGPHYRTSYQPDNPPQTVDISIEFQEDALYHLLPERMARHLSDEAHVAKEPFPPDAYSPSTGDQPAGPPAKPARRRKHKPRG
ncbi:MAG: hypothetical protein AB1716_04385 [Planctomycetota bacterium]